MHVAMHLETLFTVLHHYPLLAPLRIHTHLRTELAAIAIQKAITKNVALFLLILVIICSHVLVSNVH